MMPYFMTHKLPTQFLIICLLVNLHIYYFIKTKKNKMNHNTKITAINFQFVLVKI